MAAVGILQRVDTRDGGRRPVSAVPEAGMRAAAAALGRSRERARAREHPHRTDGLAGPSRIVARFGDWNGYGKPPGPEIMPPSRPAAGKASPTSRPLRRTRPLCGR
ncbi:hypothetical protein JCM2811A_18300 [Methylorubrum rhodinum]